MIITRQRAIDSIAAGDAHYTTFTTDTSEGDNGAWVLTNTKYARVDHYYIDDDEALAGCRECGTLVEPEDDVIGIGCHCPDCLSTL